MTPPSEGASLTTGEAAAFRRGAEAMREAAAQEARRVPIPDNCGPAEAHGRMAGSMSAAERIRALPLPEPGA